MCRLRGFNIRMWLTAVCVGAMGLSATNLSAAPQARFNAKISIYGYKSPTSSPEPYTYAVDIHYTDPEPKDPPGGGLATFGVLDSGEVQLLHHIKYIPNLTGSFNERLFYPPGEVVKTSDLPLYIMVCAWAAGDNTPPEPIFQLYTEREDANIEITDTSASVSWNTISSRRAKDKFAAQDYCGELANTKQSSVPLWFPQAGY